MPGAYLFGWDDTNKVWVKCLVNAEGKLIIDPSEIFESSPTNDEHGKAPDSDWAHDHDADPDAHRKLISIGWQINIANPTGSTLDISSEVGDTADIELSTDGTVMIIIDESSPATLYQYNLSTPFDLSTASYSGKSVDISSEGTVWSGLDAKPDGTKLYITCEDNNDIFEYTLTTGWDLFTASYSGNSYAVSEDGNIHGLVINPDNGKDFIVLGNGNNYLYKYTMSTAWDISTASYDNNSFDLSEQVGTGAVTGIDASPDGRYIFVLDNGGSDLYRYEIYDGGQAWTPTQIPGILQPVKYDFSRFSGPFDGGTSGVVLSGNGKMMYLLSQTRTLVGEFNIGFKI